MKRFTVLYLLPAILLCWAASTQIAYSGYLIYRLANANRLVSDPFLTTGYSFAVQQVVPDLDDGSVHHGDILLAINGQQLDGEATRARIWKHIRPGAAVPILVLRPDGAEKSHRELVYYHPRTHRNRAVIWIFAILLYTFLPLFGLVVGAYIVFARPRDPLAWITWAMLTSFGHVTTTGGTMAALASPWRESVIVYHNVLNITWPLWLAIFGLYFPRRFEFLRHRNWIAALIAVPLLALAGLAVYSDLVALWDVGALAWEVRVVPALQLPVVVYSMACVTGFFVSLQIKTRYAAGDDRRRLRLMVYGSASSLTPVLFLVLAELAHLHFPLWLLVTCLLPILLLPLTISYVLIVQRAMELRMVIRSGVRYAIASNTVRVVRIVLAVVLSIVVWRLVQESSALWQALVIGGLGVVLMVMLSRLGRMLASWTDRKFFREAYNAELILAQLSDEVAEIRDPRSLLETVAHRISDSLHVPQVAVLLQNAAGFQPAYALGLPALPQIELTPESTTVRVLNKERSPSRVYFEHRSSWVAELTEEERQILRLLGTQLLLPLALKERLLGFISLGPKLSEEPYSKADLQMLHAVASQTGLALENARLTENIKQEVAQRERINRELEIAREVQQQLFPQRLPRVTNLDFAGYCRPALGVGGDYYDFLSLPNGQFGLAVGDVSGKGIAAALTMASLQASLRGQILNPDQPVEQMIQHINRLVYEASSPSRYATFFYAQYDPCTRLLRYVNAGHNPPIICRTCGDDRNILRLDEGGTVLGLFSEFPFREAACQLEPGDVLIAYTDGISEAMNHAEDEWGEDNLIAAVRECCARSAADSITVILDRVDSFTKGAPQHDDMTLVVAHVQ